ncbi:MAG: chemotaxis protein CheX [Chthoniobacteraceae bacterium]
MAQDAALEEIAKQFGLEAVPESVRRVTELVACQGATTEQIAKIISQDKDLTARVLRAANPRAEDECDYTITTVDAAVMRSGIGGAILVAMSGPLIRAIGKTFETMLARPLQSVPARSLDAFTEEHVIAEVAFAGKAAGAVRIRLEKPTARLLGAAMVGLTPEDFSDEDELTDVLGELANIIVGNFKSNLCDAGLTCKLSPPTITRTNESKLRVQEGGLAERIGFVSDDVHFFVDVCVNPWSEV